MVCQFAILLNKLYCASTFFYTQINALIVSNFFTPLNSAPQLWFLNSLDQQFISDIVIIANNKHGKGLRVLHTDINCCTYDNVAFYNTLISNCTDFSLFYATKVVCRAIVESFDELEGKSTEEINVSIFNIDEIVQKILYQLGEDFLNKKIETMDEDDYCQIDDIASHVVDDYMK